MAARIVGNEGSRCGARRQAGEVGMVQSKGQEIETRSKCGRTLT